ncbi:hypothetical protein Taro_020384 [Colocasia esculenta]|uniref:Uncharacterized protein n=1 Tax=Colocasia esculenta TaxID=4460 RepID=A0A843V269_COLES|nr:hypothetical protein [Colocasia esculenta]
MAKPFIALSNSSAFPAPPTSLIVQKASFCRWMPLPVRTSYASRASMKLSRTALLVHDVYYIAGYTNILDSLHISNVPRAKSPSSAGRWKEEEGPTAHTSRYFPRVQKGTNISCKGSVDTPLTSVDTMLQSQAKMLKKWSSSVDTRCSQGINTPLIGHPTKRAFQKSFWRQREFSSLFVHPLVLLLSNSHISKHKKGDLIQDGAVGSTSKDVDQVEAVFCEEFEEDPKDQIAEHRPGISRDQASS